MSLMGSVLVGQLWWYGTAVLRPAQFLKSVGAFPRNELGRYPDTKVGKGAGKRFSPGYKKPVLLRDKPQGYEAVEDFDELSPVYTAAIEPFSGPLFDETVRAMSPFLTTRSRILDTSCGPGLELCQLAELVPGGEVVGADFSAGMVTRAAENARQKGLRNVAFFQADVGALPEVFTGAFDVIFCSLSFHHYPEPLLALKQMRRALRKGGRAFIVDAGPLWMKMLASPIAQLADPGWVMFRTGEEFEALCRDAEFSGFYWVEMLPGMGLTIATR
jgi:ubiquinone/menaquinone biosynthesis C-methylase UbiE